MPGTFSWGMPCAIVSVQLEAPLQVRAASTMLACSDKAGHAAFTSARSHCLAERWQLQDTTRSICSICLCSRSLTLVWGHWLAALYSFALRCAHSAKHSSPQASVRSAAHRKTSRPPAQTPHCPQTSEHRWRRPQQRGSQPAADRNFLRHTPARKFLTVLCAKVIQDHAAARPTPAALKLRA